MVSFFPPFRPKKHRSRRIQSSAVNARKISLTLLIPNIITIISLCAGMYSIRMVLVDEYTAAVVALLVSVVLDGVDGRVARLLKSATIFGAQLDSLADFLTFGVAPAILIYKVSLFNLGAVGWFGSLVFATAQALRLARFNAQQIAQDGSSTRAKIYAVGVPAPAGAVLVMLPIYIANIFSFELLAQLAALVFVYSILVALLVVSSLPTYSGKGYDDRIDRKKVFPLFILIVALLWLAINYPWVALTFLAFLYLFFIPVAWRARKHQK